MEIDREESSDFTVTVPLNIAGTSSVTMTTTPSTPCTSTAILPMSTFSELTSCCTQPITKHEQQQNTNTSITTCTSSSGNNDTTVHDTTVHDNTVHDTTVQCTSNTVQCTSDIVQESDNVVQNTSDMVQCTSNTTVQCTSNIVQESEDTSNTTVQCTSNIVQESEDTSNTTVQCTSNIVQESEDTSNTTVHCTSNTVHDSSHDISMVGINEETNSSIKVDTQLLSLLQANLPPHLSHVQESIKNIIQNNIIIQSMKSSLLTSTPPTNKMTPPTNKMTPPTKSRKPVLAQIITPNQTPPTQLIKPMSQSKEATPTRPLLKKLSPSETSSSKTTPIETPSIETTPTSNVSVKDEYIDVVGTQLISLQLPSALIDHTYCIYNPCIIPRPRPPPDHSLTIPCERLSYAPDVPDSPRTLFKLLKVTTSKKLILSHKVGGSSGSGQRSINRGTPYGRITKKGHRRKSSSFGIKKTRHNDSDDEGGDTPELSDEDTPSTRRRSQRNKGQRKHYIDDVTISDEETLDDILTQPIAPLKKKYHINKPFQQQQQQQDYDEESDYESSSNSISSNKQLRKSLPINPTEGFQYSDIYMDAPADEANIVDKILSQRIRDCQNDEEISKYGNNVEEFLVKYRNYSYIHVEWATSDKLCKGDKRFEGKMKRYKTKQAALGPFANVDDEPFNPDYTVADRILDIATQIEPNGEKVTHYLIKWKSLPYEDSTWELEENVDTEVIKVFLEYTTPPTDEYLQYVRRPPPNRFKPIKESLCYKGNNYLRHYQLEGLNWLLFNWYTRQNCILADEMGLGKTVQSISFILGIVEAGIRGPFLVIAPLSTIANWQREFATWTDLNVVIYHGSAYSRRMIQEYELYFRDQSGKIIIDAYKFNVIVTTYEVMLSDNSELQNIMWRAVVIDEAHRLKNKNCKMLEGLRELHMEFRVLLTGTPLQNNVEELFSLLNFLEPSQFPSQQLFLQQFGNLKTEEQVEELKLVLKPMMLRRLKEDVEKSLAPKEETIVEIELTAIQKQYYRAILERNFSFLTKGNTVPNLLNTMMELRKCCNHPFLIAGAEQKIVEDYQFRYPNKPVYDSLIQASGKLVLIDKLLPKLKIKGHKVLIFSQMVRCLDILEDYLRMKGYLYERIDGQVRGPLRQTAIDRFSNPDYDRFIFLLCTRAGGLGINLTAADTVIIYDSDWNPQNDIQAQARCHRIGQNKMVKVYRLITTNSYEREMFDRASLKLGLDKAVLQSMNTQQSNNNTNGPPQLSKGEIENLLKKGAYGAIMESDDAANQFCEEDIDQILERRTKVIQLESEGKGSTFSKASFVTNDGSSDINIDDPDFWQKWAQKANLNLDQLAKKDALVMDEPRVRKQVRRYGDEMLETIVDMSESHEEIYDIVPSKGKKGWTKLECFKTEKALLVYGWGQWRDMLQMCHFKKRQLSIKDIENISRTMLLYCVHHFTGDEKVKLFIHQLLDPSIHTEQQYTTDNTSTSNTNSNSTSNSSSTYCIDGFTEEDYLALMAKEPDTLFQEESYMKHLRRHATKILLRVRQLHIIRWQIMAPYMKQINNGILAKDLDFAPPKPEEEPPVDWWNSLCDTCLLIATVKHGYEQFSLWRSDRTLCFWELVGEQPISSRQPTTPTTIINKKRKRTNKTTPSNNNKGSSPYMEVESEEEEQEMEEEMELEMENGEGDDSDNETTPTGTTPTINKVTTIIRKTRAYTAAMSSSISAAVITYSWPSLAEINTRSRRLVNSYLKQQRREELRQVQLIKEQERKVREAEMSKKRELKKAELAQKWSKREEQDFLRVVSFYGVEYEQGTNKYDWSKFRQLANLNRKSDDRLTLYFHDFKEMCRKVIKKKRQKLGYSGIKLDAVSEERAVKCLQKIDLLTAVRREILPHPQFNSLIKLCRSSFEVPHWWSPGLHDRDLLKGVIKHGLYRTDYLLYNDPELSFHSSIPQTALFTPNYPLKEDEEGQVMTAGNLSDTEEDTKLKHTNTPVPLGWPKEKAILIRISRIIFAFRNNVWPKPMEGLDLFNPLPLLTATGSDSTSSTGSDQSIEEMKEGSDDDSDYTNNNNSSCNEFQVQMGHGLKMTLKKGSTQSTKETMNVKIPLNSLSQLPSQRKRSIYQAFNTEHSSPNKKQHMIDVQCTEEL